ncbi:MAG: hypothetical protein AVDCRST_MAG08-3590 [uncultured Acetobacteraceae bacterium]|uniref:Uncharacterized protein n=1 Tax=uncultured Acetobacteraceae bacterium TaxID=169975 RepID=A0A6J4JG93_9PROT|nr:MAG: hypothetical protein AVDCRST_MAG08-3590 [uncultured Acetobacteraceae bacterium]
MPRRWNTSPSGSRGAVMPHRVSPGKHLRRSALESWVRRRREPRA